MLTTLVSETYAEQFDKKNENYMLASLVLSILYYYIEEEDSCLRAALNAKDIFLACASKFYTLNFVTSTACSVGFNKSLKSYTDYVIRIIFSRYIHDRSMREQLSEIMNIFVSIESRSNNSMFFRFCIDTNEREIISDLLCHDKYGIYLELLLGPIKHSTPRARYLEVCNQAVEAYEKVILNPYSLAKNDYNKLIILYTRTLVITKNSKMIADLIKNLIIRNELLATQICALLESISPYQLLCEITSYLDDNVESLKNIKPFLFGNYKNRIITAVNASHTVRSDKLIDVIKENLEVKSGVLRTMAHLAACFIRRQSGVSSSLFGAGSFSSGLTKHNRLTAYAALSIIHGQNNGDPFKKFSGYIRSSDGNYNYADAGVLYGFGLAAVRSQNDVIRNYITNILNKCISAENTEHVQFGAALGLGFASLGSSDESVKLLLETVLLNDLALAGEAAAIALGLNFYGTNKQDIIEILLSAAETSCHEKIVRAAGFAIALICADQQEAAEPTIQRLLSNSIAFIRYGGAMALGLAYVTTGNFDVMQRLLSLTIKETSEEVCQASVMAMTFLFIGSGKMREFISTFKFLISSHQFRVRYSAAVVIGLVAASTGDRSAMELLMFAANDSHDLVRQASLISMGMVLMGVSDNYVLCHRREETGSIDVLAFSDGKISIYPTPSQLRDLFASLSLKTYEESMVRVGAFFGLGLIEAGSRNVTMATNIKCPLPETDECTGMNRFVQSQNWRGLPVPIETIVGFAFYTQSWYWHPYSVALNLSMRSCLLLGMKPDGTIPRDFSCTVNCKASDFSNFSLYKAAQKKNPKAIARTLLTVARRAGILFKDTSLFNIKTKDNNDEQEQKQKEIKNTETRANEPCICTVKNCSRITPFQIELGIACDPSARFTPICDISQDCMLLILNDNDPNGPVKLLFENKS